jgi:large subunit ribosomal protein L17
VRHSVYGKKLSRNKNQRTALFKSLVQSLILSESIQTTEAKAKAIKGLVDRIITQAKSPATRRLVNQFLVSKQTQEKLVKELLPRLKDRQSGYTSIIKLGSRQGDGAMMVKMTLLVSSPAKEAITKASSEKKEINAPKVAQESKNAKAPKVTKSAKEKK